MRRMPRCRGLAAADASHVVTRLPLMNVTARQIPATPTFTRKAYWRSNQATNA